MIHEPVIDYETFKDFLTSLFHFYPQYPSISSKAVQNAVAYRYTNWNNVHNTKANFENLDKAAGDFHFLCPVVDFANIFAMNHQDVYFYHYNHFSSRTTWPEWLGVLHADEISFMFGEPINPELNYTMAEKILSRKMIKYWSNFAKYQNPNGPTIFEESLNHFNRFNLSNNSFNKNIDSHASSLKENYEIKNINISNNRILTQTLNQFIETWPKYQISANKENDYQRAYINLNTEKIFIDYNLRAEYCTFWGSYLPNLVLSECKYTLKL